MSVCPYCSEEKTLVRSHIIPRGFFKPILESLPGPDKRLVIANIGPGSELDATDDQGKYPLLCKDCDQLLGKRYDGPSVAWARATLPACLNGQPVFFDLALLLGMVASVFWRASHACSSWFQGFKLSAENTVLFADVMKEPDQYLEHLGLRISVLANGCASTPMMETLSVGELRSDDNYQKFVLIAGGFFFELVLPKPREGGVWAEQFLTVEGQKAILPIMDISSDFRIVNWTKSIQIRQSTGQTTNNYQTLWQKHTLSGL